jgi:hypothetical protein
MIEATDGDYRWQKGIVEKRKKERFEIIIHLLTKCPSKRNMINCENDFRSTDRLYSPLPLYFTSTRWPRS